MTFPPTGRRCRQVLAHLADNGPVHSVTGQTTPAIADAIGISATYTSNIVCELAKLGMVERTTIGKRTFTVAITDKGASFLRVEAAINLRQAQKRQRHRVATPKATAVAPPMPVLGPIGKMTFDPERVRNGTIEAGMPR